MRSNRGDQRVDGLGAAASCRDAEATQALCRRSDRSGVAHAEGSMCEGFAVRRGHVEGAWVDSQD